MSASRQMKKQWRSLPPANFWSLREFARRMAASGDAIARLWCERKGIRWGQS